jgi:hypothetical protein
MKPCKFARKGYCTHKDRAQDMVCHRQNCPWPERQNGLGSDIWWSVRGACSVERPKRTKRIKKEDEFASFSTIFPYCKEDGSLMIVCFTARTGIPLRSDGFSTEDASSIDTEDEIVLCEECKKEFPLSEVTL